MSKDETREFVGNARGESSDGDFAPTDTFFLEINDAGEKFKLDLATHRLTDSWAPGAARVKGTFGEDDVLVVESISFDAASTPGGGGF